MKSSSSKHRGVFGLRLKTVRQSVRIPQDKLGVKIGLDELVASARISRYESGTHEPPFDIAQKLALALQVPVAYFYCVDERMAQLLLLVASFTDVEWKNLMATITLDRDTFSKERGQD